MYGTTYSLSKYTYNTVSLRRISFFSEIRSLRYSLFCPNAPSPPPQKNAPAAQPLSACYNINYLVTRPSCLHRSSHAVRSHWSTDLRRSTGGGRRDPPFPKRNRGGHLTRSRPVPSRHCRPPRPSSPPAPCPRPGPDHQRCRPPLPPARAKPRPPRRL